MAFNIIIYVIYDCRNDIKSFYLQKYSAISIKSAKPGKAGVKLGDMISTGPLRVIIM